MEILALAGQETTESAAEVMLGFGCSHVVITQSSRGCTVFHKSTAADMMTKIQTTHHDAFNVEVNLCPFVLSGIRTSLTLLVRVMLLLVDF